jgi:hypothetical protein
MSLDKLRSALDAVDWKANIQGFFSDTTAIEPIISGNLRIAIWSRQLETVDQSNPALCFVREMQASSQYATVQTALGLYKPAASSMRALLERALYYSYFRNHPAELVTLANDPQYYIDKESIVSYHKLHTPNFAEIQYKIGLISSLNQWYSEISAIVHGQVPGSWTVHSAVSEIKNTRQAQDIVVTKYAQGVEIIHRFLLVTLRHDFWDFFSASAKGRLIKGLPGDIKALLKLDSA